MHTIKLIRSVIISLLFFTFYVSADVDGLDLSSAESFYAKGDYENFLESVKQPLTQVPSLKDDIVLSAKIAFALYQVNRHTESDIVWQKVLESGSELRDYYWWYKGLNLLAKGDTLEAIHNWSLAISENSKYNLTPKMQYYSSELSAAMGNYDVALDKMISLAKSGKSAGHDKDFILSQIIKYANKSNKDSLRNIYVNKLIKNYPGSRESYYWLKELNLLDNIEGKSSSEQRLFLDILYRNRKYAEALTYIQLLENLDLKLNGNTNNYFKAEIYFNQKRYNAAYRLFNKLPLSQFKLTTQRQILRQKGRCLYRLGQRKKAYKEFEVLANRFPRWGRSLELLWVAAWDYDRKKQYKTSAYWYNKIIKLNPNSEYAWHSRFRIGFNFYLQGQYKSAISALSRISEAKIWAIWKDRARYWIAKSKEKMNDFNAAFAIYSELAERPVANYYTLQSYMIVDYFDAKKAWTEQNDYWPGIGFFASDAELDLYVDEFKRILDVEKIFGVKEAREELKKHKVKKSGDLSYYVALARLYKKLQEFGAAYRMQIKLVNQYFKNVPLSFKSPTIKFLFPLFYDEHIYENSEELEVEPEIVFAVMRQESAFQEDALSRAGATGLLQLMPATAKNLHTRIIDEPWDIGRLSEADYNIQLGIYYLSNLIARYDGNYPYVFISYNAGPSRLKKWRKRIENKDLDIFIESIEFKETRSYLRNCMRNYWVYKILLGASPMNLNDYIKDSHSIFGESSW